MNKYDYWWPIAIELIEYNFQVWPDNKTAFPDFFRQSTWNQWGYWIEVQSREIDFDGLWIVGVCYSLLCYS